MNRLKIADNSESMVGHTGAGVEEGLGL